MSTEIKTDCYASLSSVESVLPRGESIPSGIFINRFTPPFFSLQLCNVASSTLLEYLVSQTFIHHICELGNCVGRVRFKLLSLFNFEFIQYLRSLHLSFYLRAPYYNLTLF